jgi:hypothetical protein
MAALSPPAGTCVAGGGWSRYLLRLNPWNAAAALEAASALTRSSGPNGPSRGTASGSALRARAALACFLFDAMGTPPRQFHIRAGYELADGGQDCLLPSRPPALTQTLRSYYQTFIPIRGCATHSESSLTESSNPPELAPLTPRRARKRQGSLRHSGRLQLWWMIPGWSRRGGPVSGFWFFTFCLAGLVE